MQPSKYVDHTLLKPTATRDDIRKLCEEARRHHFASAVVNPCHVKYAAGLLEGSGVNVVTVIGFPLGANTSAVKAFETREAIENGAKEVDMVIDIGAAKAHDWDTVLSDIKAVVAAARGTLVKVIIETCYLTREEIAKTSELAVLGGAQFVKTSTGFGPHGARAEDVRLMVQSVGGKAKVKASGEIRNKEEFEAMIAAGAERIGCSAGVQIMDEYLH